MSKGNGIVTFFLESNGKGIVTFFGSNGNGIVTFLEVTVTVSLLFKVTNPNSGTMHGMGGLTKVLTEIVLLEMSLQYEDHPLTLETRRRPMRLVFCCVEIPLFETFRGRDNRAWWTLYGIYKVNEFLI